MPYSPPLQNNGSHLCSVMGVSGWIFWAQFRLRGQSKANASTVELGDKVDIAGLFRNHWSFTFSLDVTFGWSFMVNFRIGLVGVFFRLQGS